MALSISVPSHLQCEITKNSLEGPILEEAPKEPIGNQVDILEINKVLDRSRNSSHDLKKLRHKYHISLQEGGEMEWHPHVSDL